MKNRTFFLPWLMVDRGLMNVGVAGATGIEGFGRVKEKEEESEGNSRTWSPQVELDDDGRSATGGGRTTAASSAPCGCDTPVDLSYREGAR
jgi:hypothetical protein